MSDEFTHYQVLGLESDATPEQVRRRYRELARRHHPDVNPGKDNHDLFVRITKAYEALSDPKRRAAYDLLLRDRAQRAAGAAGPGPGNGQTRATGGGASRAAGRPFTDDYSARAGGARRTATQSRPTGHQAAAQAAAALRREMERKVQEARNQYLRGRLRDAERLCREAMKLERSALANELLGDIYERQGRLEEAVQHYTVAAQISPSTGLIMTKLNRAVDRLNSPTAGAPAAPPLSSAQFSLRLAVSFFGLALLLMLLLWRPVDDRTSLGLPLVGAWTVTHIACMALAGFLTGLLAAVAGWIRPFDHELRTIQIGRGRIPLGLLLGTLGLLFFPAALIAYVLVAYLQNSVSRSIVLAISLTASLVFAFFLTANSLPTNPGPAAEQTLFFAGNLIFTTLLVGWFLGDLFRPQWAM